MEAAAGVDYDPRGRVKAGCPTVITYADDFVALCHSREQAETVRTRIGVWLADRGLTLNQDKTRIGRIDDGFDFLSFTIRRHHVHDGPKVLTTPSHDALKKIRRRNAEQLRALRGASPAEVVTVMNPIIRGQANYYRPGASKKAYQALDNHLWQHLYNWARRRHPTKNRRWVTARYFGQLHPTRHDRWIYGDRHSGAYLHKYSWTTIVRHTPVPGRHSPDDPDLAQYGPTDDVSANHRNWPSPCNAPYASNTDNAPCVANRCCSPTTNRTPPTSGNSCLLYTSDAADEEDSVDLGGR